MTRGTYINIAWSLFVLVLDSTTSFGITSTMSQALSLALVSAVAAQSLNQSIPTSTIVNGSVVANPTAFAQNFELNVGDLWDLLVGPVASALVTTTMIPTPIPSSSLIPPPPLYYSPFPAGQQQPLEMRNESWSFPKDFCTLSLLLTT